MCGIAGVVAGAGCVDIARLRAAGARLEHRGPDDLGYLGWSAGAPPRRGREPEICRHARVGLVHRRLSILDLTEGGWQPMSSPDGRFHIVFNGEIYNYRELRAELERSGERFVSRSDTEVLLRAFAVWGVDGLSRLVGMFAFAVLDSERERLTLVRDFFGIKPLYYAVTDDGLAFGSEIKSLLELTGEPVRAHPERLMHYIRFGLTDHGGHTLFDGIRQLPAAHFVEFSLAGPRDTAPVRYWSVDLDARTDLPFDQAADRLREMFLDSVRLHLRSDVPVGAALSGGIDSSSIVMAMRHLEGDGLDLHTISYIADDPTISEERWVDVVAGASRATVHRTRPEPEELAGELERLIEVQDEPFASTSIYAQHRVFGLAAHAGIKVMLDGQGADELLGGYRIYLSARLASLVRQGRLVEAARLLGRTRGVPGTRPRDVLVWLGYNLLPAGMMGAARRLSGRPVFPEWLRPGWFRDHEIGLDSPIAHARSRHALRETLHLNLTSSSVPQLLRYEDRNSMAFSIESRVPFLTPQLASYVLSLPEHYILTPDLTSKAIFRRAMRGLVPDAILDRRDKIGFSTPERDWLVSLRGWVEGILGGETAHRVPVLDVTAMQREWAAIAAGHGKFDWHVWRWINLIRWVERFDVAF